MTWSLYNGKAESLHVDSIDLICMYCYCSKSYVHIGSNVGSPNMSRRRIRGSMEMAGGGYNELEDSYLRSEYLASAQQAGMYPYLLNMYMYM